MEATGVTMWRDGWTSSGGQGRHLVPAAVGLSASIAAHRGMCHRAAAYHDGASLHHHHRTPPYTLSDNQGGRRIRTADVRNEWPTRHRWTASLGNLRLCHIGRWRKVAT
ncbi:unnamed protein product [Lampetra fluviatilis]